MIFLTSKEEEVDEVLALKVGADDFIRKPFSQRLLLERVKVLLRARDLKGWSRLEDSLSKMCWIAVNYTWIPSGTLVRGWANRSR